MIYYTKCKYLVLIPNTNVIEKLLIFSLVFVMCISISYAEEQKSIQLVGVKTAKQHGLDGQGIKVGIIDTGIDFNHPNLQGYGQKGKIFGGYNFANPNQTPLDTNGHGTEVAGIIAAEGSFTGSAPKSQLYSYKVSYTGESVSSEYIIQAISHAIADKMNVINISLGVNKTNDEL